MKKLLSVFIVVLLLLCAFSFSTFADENIGTLKAERVTANPGDEIIVPVSLVNHNGVFIFRATVMYDTKVMECIEVIKSASAEFNYTVNTKTEGQVIVLMDAQQLANVEGDIKLFELKFKVKADAKAGRTLIPVSCEEGMATMLIGSGASAEPVGFVPATSSGAVTVLCKEHAFAANADNSAEQCSICGAVKDASGNVSIDSLQGLPEVDISSDSSENPSDNTSSVNPKEEKENKSEKEDDISWIYIIGIVAVVIIGAIIAVIIINKKRNKQD